MAVKDWIPVAQDIYDALIADGIPKQEQKLKISHGDLCKILDKHCIAVTEAMNKHANMFNHISNLANVIDSTDRDKDLSKSLYDNGLFKGDLTEAEESLAYSSHNIPKAMWVYQIAHKLQFAFEKPKAKEEAIKDEEEKEIANEDVEFVEDNSFDEPSDYPKVHACKTDYDKIICKLGAVKLSLGVVSLSDVVKVIGEEMLPNVRGKDSFTQIIPGDPRFINVLDIMNKIVSTINLNYQDSRMVAISILKGLLSDLEGTIKSLDSKPNQNDTEKCNKVCDYLLDLKSKNDGSLECLTIPAFFDVMIKFDIIESDEEILKKLQENPMINIVFFELIKSVKTLEVNLLKAGMKAHRVWFFSSRVFIIWLLNQLQNSHSQTR